MAFPETASTAFVTRTVMKVKPGSPAPPAVKVIVSCAADQAKVPLTAGLVTNAAWTLFVSIGLLNWSTMGDHVGTLDASCAGELLIAAGSSGRQSVCATKIFAIVPG